MYLFFDVETTGLPKKWNLPHTDTYNWPRMVQLAWLLYDKEQELQESFDLIIRPEGFEIPYDAERIHGISTEKAKQEGTELEGALYQFAGAIDRSQYLIAHNLNFDEKVVGAEFLRKNVAHRLFETERYCTMRESTYYCKIPGKYGRYKWPSLAELHYELFDAGFEEAHNAKADVAACARCFFKLIEIEAIDLF